MKRTVRTVVAMVVLLGVVGLQPADAATVKTPWAKDDTVGEAYRPQGDIRRVVVENTRQALRVTVRMQAQPIWDDLATNRWTYFEVLIDWKGTGAAFDSRVTFSNSEGSPNSVVFLPNGSTRCVGPMQLLPNNRFRVSFPKGFALNQCMGGARTIRVKVRFRDDIQDDGGTNIKIDNVPNAVPYGPWIRLP